MMKKELMMKEPKNTPVIDFIAAFSAVTLITMWITVVAIFTYDWYRF